MDLRKFCVNLHNMPDIKHIQKTLTPLILQEGMVGYETVQDIEFFETSRGNKKELETFVEILLYAYIDE